VGGAALYGLPTVSSSARRRVAVLPRSCPDVGCAAALSRTLPLFSADIFRIRVRFRANRRSPRDEHTRGWRATGAVEAPR
jgi:hypothetical protein